MTIIFTFTMDMTTVYKTEKRTGMSDKLVDGYCLQLNMVDGKIYANMAQDESVIEIEPESGDITEIRKAVWNI